MNTRVNEYWNTFLKETGRSQDTKYYEAFYFGSTETMATELLELVLKGQKRATASALLEYINRGESIPQVHDLSIVTDWEGNPKCIIQTTAVSQLKFKDVTYEICKREGEDENLESWQRNHIKFFQEAGKQEGYEFSWDMDIIFEDFKVIY